MVASLVVSLEGKALFRVGCDSVQLLHQMMSCVKKLDHSFVLEPFCLLTAQDLNLFQLNLVGTQENPEEVFPP